MEIVGWVLWTILLWSAATSLYWFAKKTGGVQAATVSTLVNQWILVAWSLCFPQFNKLHLLWLTPLSYVWGLPGMFAFAFIRSKWIILTVAVAINLFLLSLLTQRR
jgi:hypothetical protein